jgi:hypothetical protein
MSSEPQPEIREKQPFLREWRASAIGEAPRAGPRSWIDWPRSADGWIQLAAWTFGPGTILSLLGPFGTFLAPLWLRFAYWVPTMAIGVGIGWFASVWADRQPWLAGRPWARIAVLSVIMTVFMSVVVWLWTPMVFGGRAPIPGPILIFYVWVISVIMGIAGHFYGEHREREALALDDSPVPAPQVAQAARPATLGQRLKPGLRNAPILALEAEDHYVRIHTAQGSELILIRLADAIIEMGDVEGARTHRSWWVARAAVKESRRSDGRATLTLSNGAEAPVSRNAVGELVEKGWL